MRFGEEWAGVAPSRSSKFIESFIEGALAAELDDDVILCGPANGHDAAEALVEETESATPPTTGAQAPLRRAGPASAAPTIRQSWPIGGGEMVVERLEALATSLAAEIPTGSTGEIEP